MRADYSVFLSLIPGYIIHEESNEELKTSIYSQMAKSIFTGVIHYMQPEMSRMPAEFIFISFDEYPFRSYLTEGC